MTLYLSMSMTEFYVRLIGDTKIANIILRGVSYLSKDTSCGLL